MDTLTFSGTAGIVVLSAYAAMMLLIGYFVGRGKQGTRHDMKGHYLAGGNLGVIVLFFTLYATQYSGNTVIGYAPQAYREGFPWWQSVTFFTAIIAGYMLFAPRLYVLAKKHSFITPTDWVRHRFGSPAVTLLAAFLMLWGLANYLLEQLIAMGHAITGLTGNTVPYQAGVAVFVCVMLTYSWMGGMRAVALTDVMQGVALLLGVLALLIGAFSLAGGSPVDTAQYLVDNEPEAMAVPSLTESINWLSMIIMVGVGLALYPHAIQRIYSARSERTLKRSLLPMVWMPLITAGVVFCIGMVGIRLFPGLSDSDAEQLVGMIANEVAGVNIVFYIAMVLLFGGVVAAIVSTADSVLLSFSSIVSQDIYARYVRPEASEHRQVLAGKIIGVVVVFGLLVLAWNPPSTLVNIFVLKIELLVQLAPAFILGLYWNRLAARPVFWGMAAGAALAGGMTIVGVEAIYGVHGGMVGLLLNLVICVVGSLLPHRTGVRPGPRGEEEVLPAVPDRG
ncbi:SSS family solute:Na+ symporter/sodium/pantothenate symporter [Halopolyspora algeriensis]|uniref:SSS family solute:Na+ symporter/sodium/pantothenate symporter n=1 Tax=Halopolyspora algeriensis TaxID=1500506 RepID=A0A368VWQ7_9ACTN|nr:sodium:solute symporter family protein [Halopolyspora algeriensis]RCW45800.1 SSS family solute:Na+ symporter/sodium/pantothenate symporter [Halopolyspora algeriensis]TQM54184.1 SSS family solute:Na+ symporter/sodium/pantothenate symporter [Halopolyspora algeriensis]